MKNKLILFALIFFLLCLGVSIWFVFNNNWSEKETQNQNPLAKEINTVKKKSALPIAREPEKLPDTGEGLDTTQLHEKKIDKNEIVETKIPKDSEKFSETDEIHKQIELPMVKRGDICETFQLIGLIDRKPISNQVIAIAYFFEIDNPTKHVEYLKLTTDDTGKLRIHFKQAGNLIIQFQVEGFAIWQNSLMIRYWENNKTIHLSQGGELTIKAVNEKNEVVKNLEVYLADVGSQKIPINNGVIKSFDEKTGLYLIKNVPLGLNLFSFKAIGTIPSEFKIPISAEKLNYFDLQLKTARKINLKFIGLTYQQSEIPVAEIVRNDANKNSYLLNTKGLAYLIENGKYQYENIYQKMYKPNQNDKAIYHELLVQFDGYVPILLNIQNSKDDFDLQLKKGSTVIVKIRGEDMLPIKNALISYNLFDFVRQEKTSDNYGVAILENLPESVILLLEFRCQHYCKTNKVWNVNRENYKELVITLKKSYDVFGVIQNKTEYAPDVDVLLYEFNPQINDYILKDQQKSDAKGNFSFENLLENKYRIKCFHSKYGNAVYDVDAAVPQEGLTILLQEEKNLTISLVDENNNPISRKNLMLFDVNQTKKSLPSISFSTDAIGKVELYNVSYGNYHVVLNDEEYDLTEPVTVEISKIPKELILKAKSKEIKKISFYQPSGKLYTGKIKGTVAFTGTKFPLEFHLIDSESISFKIDSKYFNGSPEYELKNWKNFSLQFEFEEYFPVRLGPYENFFKMQDGMNIILKDGISYYLLVKNAKTALPLPYATVTISSGPNLILSGETDEKGYLKMDHIEVPFLLKVEALGFAPFFASNEELGSIKINVNLIAGGSLKGVLPMASNVNTVFLKLVMSENPSHAFEKTVTSNDGKFQINNLPPGTYSMSRKYMYKSGQEVSWETSKELIIENEKETELNLEVNKK